MILLKNFFFSLTSNIIFLILILFCVFVLIHKAGGDTIVYNNHSKFNNQHSSIIIKNSKDFTLKKFYVWLKNASTFNFGHSLINKIEVKKLIKPALFNSLSLNILALLLTLIIGIFIGISSTLLPEKFSYFVDSPLFLLYAIPDFLMCILLLSFFSFGLHIFPSYGAFSLNFQNFNLYDKIVDIIYHLTLPALALAAASLVFISRFTKSTFEDTKKATFIKAMISRGVSTKYIVKALAKNTIFPFISMLSILIPSLVGGSVIVESIFSFPGIGMLFYKSIMARDYPVVLAITFINIVFVFVGFFVSNILYKKFNRGVLN